MNGDMNEQIQRKENIKRINSSVILHSSVQLKLNYKPKPFYFKGCILKYDVKNDRIFFWDIVDGVKEFQLDNIMTIKIIQTDAFSIVQIKQWLSQMPKVVEK